MKQFNEADSIPILQGYVDTQFGQIHYRQAGNAGISPSSPPLILLHQTASSSVMYEAMMCHLSQHFWCIAPDTLGFGASHAPSNPPLSIADHAQAFHDMLAILGVTTYTLFGHHTGAAIAVQMATDRPEQVKKLILSGPPLLTIAQIDGLSATLPDAVPQPNGEHLLETWARIAKKEKHVPRTLVQREMLLTLQAGQHYPQAYHAVFAQDFAGQLRQLSCPTLVIAGEHDSLIASLEPTFRLLSQGDMCVIENAGTFVCDLQPKKIANIVLQFCKVE